MESNVRQRRRQIEEITEENETTASNATRPATNSFYLALVLTISIIIISAFVGYVISPISTVPIEGVVDVQFSGPFAMNDKLTKGKQIPMYAPECVIEDDNGNLYAGLYDGKIVKVSPSPDGIIGEGDIETVVSGIIDTDDVTTSDIPHGRPLGLRLRNNILYVMDAIYGFYTVDLDNKEIKILIRPSDVDPPMKFPNDLDITSDGNIVYFTDSSARHPITRLINEALEGTCTGRLFKYDLISRKLVAVAGGLCFANGVQLTSDETVIIVPETTRYRALWIDTKTWKTKHVLHFPAMPDNVRRNKKGSYWIGASAKLTKPLRMLFNFPTLRQIVVGLLPQNLLLKVPNRKHNMLFEVNDHGEIYETLHDPDGKLTYALAQGTELSDGRIAICTYTAHYLAIVDTPTN